MCRSKVLHLFVPVWHTRISRCHRRLSLICACSGSLSSFSYIIRVRVASLIGTLDIIVNVACRNRKIQSDDHPDKQVQTAVQTVQTRVQTVIQTIVKTCTMSYRPFISYMDSKVQQPY